MPTVILRNASDQGHHVGHRHLCRVKNVHSEHMFDPTQAPVRRYCHLITLVTSVYRKTNVFLTTVGTATPPGGEMGEWSPFIVLGCALQSFDLFI